MSEPLQETEQPSIENTNSCEIKFYVTQDGEISSDSFFTQDEVGIFRLASLYNSIKNLGSLDNIMIGLIGEMTKEEAMFLIENIRVMSTQKEPVIQPINNCSFATIEEADE